MNSFETYLLTTKKLSVKSASMYQFYLAKWQSWLAGHELSAESIGYEHLLLYIGEGQQKGEQKRYLNAQLGAIRHYFEYLINQQRVDYNPATNLVIRGVKQAIPHGLLHRDELDALYEAYPLENPTKLRNKILLGLLVFQAITTGELLPLTAAHIGLEKGQVHLPASSYTQARSLKLEACQMIPLQTYLAMLPTPKPLFTDQGQEKQLNNRLTYLMGELRRINPGVKNASQLRQSVITEWLKVKDIRYVQQWAGHRYVSSTQRYQTQDLAALQADLNRFHPLN